MTTGLKVVLPFRLFESRQSTDVQALISEFTLPAINLASSANSLSGRCHHQQTALGTG